MPELSPKTAQNQCAALSPKGSVRYEKGGPGGVASTTAGPEHQRDRSASMNESADTRIPSGEQSQIPVTIYDEAKANAAWLEFIEAKAAAELARAKADRARERFIAAFVAGAA